MTATQIIIELEKCRNARPETDAEIDALVARIDAAGKAAAGLKNVKTSHALTREACALSDRYLGVNVPDCLVGQQVIVVKNYR